MTWQDGSGSEKKVLGLQIDPKQLVVEPDAFIPVLIQKYVRRLSEVSLFKVDSMSLSGAVKCQDSIILRRHRKL